MSRAASCAGEDASAEGSLASWSLERIIACAEVTPVARILAPRGLVPNFQASYARVTLIWGIFVPRSPYSLQAELLKP